MHAMSWGGTYSYAGYDFSIASVTVLRPANSVGLEDGIRITSGNYNLQQNSYQAYQAMFFDEYPYGDCIDTWSWQITAYHNDGSSILASATTTGASSTSWNAYIPDLPAGFNWLRNSNGLVRGDIVLTALDSDGVTHTVTKEVGIYHIPGTPQILNISQIDNIVNFNFANDGATSYLLYYDTDTGTPYNGTSRVNRCISTLS